MDAARAAVDTFRRSPDDSGSSDRWDVYEARIQRYRQFAAYYDNTAYSDLNAYAIALKSQNKLYKHIRGIYNPVMRYVELYVSKVYGGQLDMETLTGGAVPIVGASAELTNAIRQVWIWSNWGRNKSLYVRYGAKLGDSFIKIVDDRAKSKVRMEVLHPSKIRSLVVDEVGSVKQVVIEYTRLTDPSNPLSQPYTYRETIDGEWFRTYKNGEPFALHEDGAGNPLWEWPNEYGFVPLVLAQHKDMGRIFGMPGFAEALYKIDEINDGASLLNDNVRKSVNVLWWLPGVSKGKGTGGLDVSTEDRDSFPAIYAPAGTQPFAMVHDIDITSALLNIDSMSRELERDMPELGLTKVRESGDMTAPGVRAGYSDAIGRIAEAQGNYDDALIRAQQMAVSIGGYNGYSGFEAFNLDSYERGDLEHTIAERPAMDDALSLKEKVDTLQAAGAPIWLLLQEMNFSEEIINRVIAEEETRTRNAVRGFTEGVYGAAADSNADIPTEDLPIDEAGTPS